MSLQKLSVLIVAGVLAGFTGEAAVKAAVAERSLKFNSPSVLDLSLGWPRIEGKALLPDPLASSVAEEIRAARKVEANPNLLDDITEKFDCAKQTEACEANRLAASGGVAKRQGKRLQIASKSGPLAAFIDLDIPASEGHERDAYRYGYQGRLQGSGYQRVEEEFSEDSPGSFLINVHNGKVAFVHQYDDVVVPAPDGMHLITVNYLNLPFILRVAALDANGPRVALICAAPRKDRSSLATFKGWRDANTLNVVIETGIAAAKKKIAPRATRNAGAWHIATNDAAALDAAGIGCTTPNDAANQ